MNFYIASLKHTIKDHEHITFWGPDHRGYVLIVKDGHTGEYALEEARQLNDGFDCIAVPVDAVKALLSPEPYYRRSNGEAHRFYDIPGPVVDNTRANWNRLIAASLPDGRIYKPKPEVHRKARRSFALPEPWPTDRLSHHPRGKNSMNERIEEILRNPAVLKTAEGDDYTDDTAAKWAWLAHGYDTGMEPFYSIDQLRQAVRSAAGQPLPPAMTPELNEVLQFLYGADFLDGACFSEVPPGQPTYWWRAKLRAAINDAFGGKT